MKIKLKHCLLSLSLIMPTLSHAMIPEKITNKFDVSKISLNSIIIEAPELAENGAVVTIKIRGHQQLPEGVVITEVILFNDFRDQALARFILSSKMIAAGLAFRIKMQATGKVYAMAKLSNGDILTGEKMIKVTIGGCGGGGGIREVSRFTTLPQSSHYTTISPNRAAVLADKYFHNVKNTVFDTQFNPISSFSVDVDTASYSNVRQYIINQGQLPVIDAIRVEEMINYFNYHYPEPISQDRPFSVTTEIGPNPWNKNKHLLHIGLKGYQVPKQELPAANLVFLIDVSGSMSAYNKLGLLKTAMKMLTRQLQSRDRISIIVYAGASGVVLEPTAADNHAAIFSALDRLSAGGSTNGGSGINLAYQMARRAFIKGGINRVLLATDGDFNVGTVNHQQLIKLIETQRKHGISLSTLGFGRGNYNDHLMEQLADKGNGNSAYIDNIREAKKVLVNQLSSTLFTIAKDVKIQIQFNPNVIAEYRLIGYENRHLSREDFKNDKIDAGDIGAGHTVTAIYEIVLQSSKQTALGKFRYQKITKPELRNSTFNNEIALLRLRYKKPNSNISELHEQLIRKSDIQNEIHTTSNAFQFSAAVAAFGQRLFNSQYINEMNYGKIKELAENALGNDRFGYRRELVEMIDIVLNL